MEGGRWRQEEKERKEMMNFIRIIYSIPTSFRLLKVDWMNGL